MSKSTLYDIANEFEKSLDNLLDHEDSDLISEIESIEGEFKSKSANVAKYIRNLEHLASGIFSSSMIFTFKGFLYIAITMSSLSIFSVLVFSKLIRR